MSIDYKLIIWKDAESIESKDFGKVTIKNAQRIPQIGEHLRGDDWDYGYEIYRVFDVINPVGSALMGIFDDRYQHHENTLRDVTLTQVLAYYEGMKLLLQE